MAVPDRECPCKKILNVFGSNLLDALHSCRPRTGVDYCWLTLEKSFNPMLRNDKDAVKN